MKQVLRQTTHQANPADNYLIDKEMTSFAIERMALTHYRLASNYYSVAREEFRKRIWARRATDWKVAAGTSKRGCDKSERRLSDAFVHSFYRRVIPVKVDLQRTLSSIEDQTAVFAMIEVLAESSGSIR
jgi:hypothetical protein